MLSEELVYSNDGRGQCNHLWVIGINDNLLPRYLFPLVGTLAGALQSDWKYWWRRLCMARFGDTCYSSHRSIEGNSYDARTFDRDKPETVDFSDPDLPPGSTKEKIAAGIEATLTEMKARGWEPTFCSILTDDSAEATIAASLAERWDCVVIGGGIRIPSRNLELFERVVNAVRRGASDTPIAFNTSPNNTADAAARWLGR